MTCGGRVEIEVIDGVLIGSAYVERSTNAEFTTVDELFYQEFRTPLALDRQYLLWIERTLRRVVFGIDNERITYNITTPAYTPSPAAQGGLAAPYLACPGHTRL